MGHYPPDYVLEELKKSHLWQKSSRVTPRTIQNLICPVCSDKSAYAFTEAPFAVCCNKKNSCGINTPIQEAINLQPFDFAQFASKTDRHAPAREYLRARGINYALHGLAYEYWPKCRQNRNGAVMFPVGTDEKGKTVHCGRLFRPGPNEGKTHFTGSTSGLFWQHPGLDYSGSTPVSICEGIITALSLIELTHEPAVAVLSSGTRPDKLNLPQSWTVRLCFDPDPAGISATRTWSKYYPQAEVWLPDHPGKSKDWNDILKEKTRGIQ